MIELIILGVILALLFVGGLLSDYVLPHIGPLMRYLDRLPLSQPEESPVPCQTPVPRMDTGGREKAA